MLNMSVSQMDSTPGQAALLGISTPVSGVGIASSRAEILLAIVSTRLGTLSVDPAPGITVHGNGSTSLWLSGNVAQINAKLATLSYVGATAGADQIAITLIDGQGTIINSSRVPLAVMPLVANKPTDAVVDIDHGTLTLDTRVVDGPIIALSEPLASQNATTAILINTTIGANSAVSVHNGNLVGSVAPRLAIAGRVEFDGAISFSGNGTSVLLAQGATLVNEGSMTIGAGAAQFTGAGTLVNDGTITLVGNNTAATVRMGLAIDGTGQIALTAGASLSVNAAVAASETVLLGNGANTLHLTTPATFAGMIAGFSQLDTLVLDGVSASAGVYTAAADAGSGTLTLLDGQQVVAKLHFSAADAGSTFQLGTTAAGDTTVRLATIDSPATADTLDVYRFFDATHGTQILTSNGAERDSILGTRPDLHYEGVEFKAVDPAQADVNTVAIYRFFDTSNGTHFMTASATERDDLLSTRADLVYEPSSTMFEHATAQAGDQAVYRFFDQTSGAHFFTASADERASILSTRPDMTAEGIAFYAPT